MRTARSLIVSRSIKWGEGGWADPLLDADPPSWRQTPSPTPVDGMTVDASENITLPQTSFTGGNY